MLKSLPPKTFLQAPPPVIQQIGYKTFSNLFYPIFSFDPDDFMMPFLIKIKKNYNTF